MQRTQARVSSWSRRLPRVDMRSMFPEMSERYIGVPKNYNRASRKIIVES